METVSAARRLRRQGRAPWEAFADDGVQPVVDSVLVFPQKLHHRVVRLAGGRVNIRGFIHRISAS